MDLPRPVDEITQVLLGRPLTDSERRCTLTYHPNRDFTPDEYLRMPGQAIRDSCAEGRKLVFLDSLGRFLSSGGGRKESRIQMFKDIHDAAKETHALVLCTIENHDCTSKWFEEFNSSTVEHFDEIKKYLDALVHISQPIPQLPSCHFLLSLPFAHFSDVCNGNNRKIVYFENNSSTFSQKPNLRVEGNKIIDLDNP
jgi:hypothetical protein